MRWIMKEHRKRLVKNITREGDRSNSDLSPLRNQLLPTFSAGLKSAGCRSQPQSLPPALWWRQRWSQGPQAGCCSSEEWRCRVGGASGQWVALGKDRQMQIRLREIWQLGLYQAVKDVEVPVVLGIPEAGEKSNEKWEERSKFIYLR